MWAMQQENGIIEVWHARMAILPGLTIMYNLWKKARVCM